jgi:UDP-glucuronate 4-epimerase
MHVLVTGSAGFIGFHLCRRLLSDGAEVTGIDNLNDYYDPALKRARIDQIAGASGFRFEELDITDDAGLGALYDELRPEIVVHLAAQVGVRFSVQEPAAYLQSNIVGFFNVLEGARRLGVRHLVYASSSSVYGACSEIPFSVRHNVDRPISFYAASKKSNELMAHVYSHLHQLPTTGLRFFTVYGPWGRPDMALFAFTRAILAGEPIDVYNRGALRRDFTYIDDVVEGLVRVMHHPPGTGAGGPPYRLYNLGRGEPVELLRFIELIEQNLGKAAIRNLVPMQPGDMEATWAETDDLEREIGYRPTTELEEGVRRFVEWYRGYYGER